MRWRYFWNKEKTEEEIENEEPFQKNPWYQAKGTAAPKACNALEAFIEACSRKFLDPKNRKKIKSNLNQEMKKSIKKLKNLPATHGVGVRYADKSGKAVLTNLDEDDEDILDKLNDPNYYDPLQADPSDAAKEEIEAWADKYKEEHVIDDDVHKQCTKKNKYT